jgi:hypothetical protein
MSCNHQKLIIGSNCCLLSQWVQILGSNVVVGSTHKLYMVVSELVWLMFIGEEVNTAGEKG